MTLYACVKYRWDDGMKSGEVVEYTRVTYNSHLRMIILEQEKGELRLNIDHLVSVRLYQE